MRQIRYLTKAEHRVLQTLLNFDEFVPVKFLALAASDGKQTHPQNAYSVVARLRKKRPQFTFTSEPSSGIKVTLETLPCIIPSCDRPSADNRSYCRACFQSYQLGYRAGRARQPKRRLSPPAAGQSRSKVSRQASSLERPIASSLTAMAGTRLSENLATVVIGERPPRSPAELGWEGAGDRTEGGGGSQPRGPAMGQGGHKGKGAGKPV